MKNRQEVSDLNKQIKAEALRLGFSACGIARADAVSAEHADYFVRWLKEERYAEMHYMKNHLALRLDPRELHPGTRSIISVALAGHMMEMEEDYHKVIKKKLKQLLLNVNGSQLSALSSQLLSESRICVDSAPILERYWAQQAGIGWIGRNHNLIVPKTGSFVMLGEILTPLELEYDTPLESQCGDCDKCIKACPDGALCESFDAGKCVSYLTIEDPSLGEHRRDRLWAKENGKPYGCEICQKVCPFNSY